MLTRGKGVARSSEKIEARCRLVHFRSPLVRTSAGEGPGRRMAIVARVFASSPNSA
jgi:hypothetical protein